MYIKFNLIIVELFIDTSSKFLLNSAELAI